MRMRKMNEKKKKKVGVKASERERELFCDLFMKRLRYVIFDRSPVYYTILLLLLLLHTANLTVCIVLVLIGPHPGWVPFHLCGCVRASVYVCVADTFIKIIIIILPFPNP